jgi:hypothetical protein
VRYATDTSSYSSLHTSKAATPTRREIEEQAAARELEAQRLASRQRVLSVWEGLERRYSRGLDQDDIVDLENLTLIQDSGTLMGIRNVPFGSLAAPEPGEAESESDEDEEDELGAWDDERHSAQVFPTEIRIEPRRPPPLTEDDKRDLEEFLRAEESRRQEGGWLDERDFDDHENDSVDYTEVTEEVTEDEPEPIRHRIQREEAHDPSEEEDEEGSEEDREEEEEDESASSFRPTPSEDRQTASVSAGSASGSEESEDEIAQLVNYKSRTQSKSPKHSRTHSPTRTSEYSDAGTAPRAVVQYTESVEESSEDDLAGTNDQHELESTYIRARTVEPSLGRRSMSPVKRAIAPSVKPPSTRRSLSVSPVKLISAAPRVYGNPQLYTPPRSKSSVFSTPDDVLRSGSVMREERQHSVTRSIMRHPSVISELGRAKDFTKPEGILGKRKRVSSPLSTPTPSWKRIPTLEDRREKTPRHQLRFADEDSGEESPDPLESVFDEDEITPSKASSYRLPSERPPSPLANKGPYGRSEVRTKEKEYLSTREESIQPADLSQLVFHLRKVNEWVKNHHVEGLLEDEDVSDAGPSTLKPDFIPKNPPRTSNTSLYKRSPPQLGRFPYLTPRKKDDLSSVTPQKKSKNNNDDDNDLFITPKNIHRTISSLPGSVSSSAQSVRSTTSNAMGPPPTPLRLFSNSPLKPSSSQSSLTSRSTPRPSPSKESSRYSGKGRTVNLVSLVINGSVEGKLNEPSQDESDDGRHSLVDEDDEDESERPSSSYRSSSRLPTFPPLDLRRGQSRGHSASPSKGSRHAVPPGRAGRY